MGGSGCCSIYSRAGAEEESRTWTRFRSKAVLSNANVSFWKDPDVDVKQLPLSGCWIDETAVKDVSWGWHPSQRDTGTSGLLKAWGEHQSPRKAKPFPEQDTEGALLTIKKDQEVSLLWYMSTSEE